MRLTRTRSEAAEACRAGHVEVNGRTAKPSTPVRVGDRVDARIGRRDRVVEVVALRAKRVGASLAAECYADHSPPVPEPDESPPAFGVRDPGTGRPTKRDRRRLDRLRGRR